MVKAGYGLQGPGGDRLGLLLSSSDVYVTLNADESAHELVKFQIENPGRNIIHIFRNQVVGDDFNPVERVLNTIRMLTEEREWGGHRFRFKDYVHSVVMRNEQNLNGEHQFGDHWSTYAGYEYIDWENIQLLKYWVELAPQYGIDPFRVKLRYPALSPGHNPDSNNVNCSRGFIDKQVDRWGSLPAGPESEYYLLFSSLNYYLDHGMPFDFHIYTNNFHDEWVGAQRLFARILPAFQVVTGNRRAVAGLKEYNVDDNPSPDDRFVPVLERLRDWSRFNPVKFEYAAWFLGYSYPGNEHERLSVINTDPNLSRLWIIDEVRSWNAAQEGTVGMTWDDMWNWYIDSLNIYPAFAKKAATEFSYDAPVTAERDFVINGVVYRAQGYIKGLVYSVVGQWAQNQIKIARKRNDLPA